MTSTVADRPAQAAPNWSIEMRRYRSPDDRRAVFEILTTAIPFAFGFAALTIAIVNGWILLYLLLLLPTAGFLVRLFMIQHDCGHGSFFAGRRANDWTGRILSLLTLTPYDHWRRSHALHHARAGNLDHRGIGDVDTLTVREYRARGRWGRLRYRLYRHPAVMFGLGPTYLFLIQNRVPLGFLRRAGAMPWISTMGTNASLLAVTVVASLTIGLGPFLLVALPVMILAATVGVWLFYVQHQFEETYWEKSDHWDSQDAALQGSSHYDLPVVLQWMTANIGLHHIHHLSSRIPFYRLPEVLRDHPVLCDVSRLTLMDSFRCVMLVLWDEDARQLVSFSGATRAR
jgi:omega-6 fatty acid desaturase (delta-12 desaturase)